jgi:hypothetical protein
MTNRYFDLIECRWNVDPRMTTKTFMGDAKPEHVDAVLTLLPAGLIKAAFGKARTVKQE